MLREITIEHTRAMVTCIAAHEDLKHLAVGMADGTVLVSKGDLIRARTSNKPLRQSFASKDPVMGLHFHSSQHQIACYVATASQIVLNVVDPQERVEVLGQQGAALVCTAMTEDGHLWVAGEEVGGGQERLTVENCCLG